MVSQSPNPANAASAKGQSRVGVAGKYLVRGDADFFLNGVSYGPFQPNARGEPFPEPDRLSRDFAHIRSLGFNTVRVYELPTHAVLSAAETHGLQLLVGIPWTDHVDFL